MTRTGYCFGGPLDGKTITSDRAPLRAVQETQPSATDVWGADVSPSTPPSFTTMHYEWVEYAWASPWQRMVHYRAPWMIETTQPRIVGCWLPSDNIEYRKQAIEEQLRALDYVRLLWVKAAPDSVSFS